MDFITLRVYFAIIKKNVLLLLLLLFCFCFICLCVVVVVFFCVFLGGVSLSAVSLTESGE